MSTISKSKTYLSVSEAAEYLGIARQTLYQMIHRRDVPYYKPTARVLFRQDELDSYIERHRVASARELDERAAKFTSPKNNRV